MILFKSTYRKKLADCFKQKVVMTMSINSVKVRAMFKATTRDLMNYKNRIAYREVDRLSCLFVNMQFLSLTK